MKIIMFFLLWATYGYGQYEDEFNELLKEEMDVEGDDDVKKIKNYKVNIDVVNDKKSIKKSIELLIDLVRYQKRPPSTEKGLIRRIEMDMKKIRRFLKSIGYYKNHTYYVLNRGFVHLKIDPGPFFKLGEIKLEFNGESIYPLSPKQIKSFIDKRLDQADSLNTVQQRLEDFFKKNNFPFCIVDAPQGFLKEDNILNVVFQVHLGPLCRVRGIHIEAKGISQKFIENRIFFKKNKNYELIKIDQTVDELRGTDIFDQVSVTPYLINSKDKDQKYADICIHVKTHNAPPRLIGAGASYATDEGFGAKFFWKHFNMKELGHKVSFLGKKSARMDQIEVDYMIPDVGFSRHNLTFNTSYIKENRKAYKGHTAQIGGQFKYAFKKNFTIFYGALVEYAKLSRDGTRYVNKVMGIPMGAFFDFSNNFLNPTRGFRIDTNLTPYMGHIANQNYLLSATVKCCLYIPLKTNELNEDTISLAFFSKIGSLFMKNFNNLSPNKRLYSGGNGSVRAYYDQMIGQLDNQGVPIGGQSLFEIGGECRFPIKKEWAGAIFIEGGGVFVDKMPKFSLKSMQAGAGFGIRYMSGLGPIRADIAFPFQKRRDLKGKFVDAPFRFYLGLAQAF
jgi:translocation and assembly module TamA